ncbi:MAG: EAL domain-containing protein [Rhodospirillaceae bacterium]|nr:EAL domain-containing protein [Rhodospirillaceae bacterium]
MLLSFQSRLALFFAALFVAVQTIAFVAVRNAILANIAAQSSDQLTQAYRLFTARVEDTAATLTGWSTVLASDFGFRQAVASDDRPTIVSAVSNLAARMSADRVMLISLEARILADTGSATDGAINGNIVTIGDADGVFAFPDLIETADVDGRAVGFVVMNDRLYQLVIVPILAPVPIAWIAIGAEIDDAFARRLAGEVRTPLAITFTAEQSDRRSWRVAATTLPASLAPDVAAFVPTWTGGDRLTPRTVTFAAEEFATLVTPLPAPASGTRVAAVLQYSIDAALQPFGGMFQLLVALAAAFLTITVAGALIIARSVAKPIRVLDEAARRIQQGDYMQKVPVAPGDEIGRLSETFNQMMDRIAEREMKIEHQSLHDPATGLPNRAAFERYLTTSIQWAEQSGRALSVYLVQIGRFSEINNTFGHDVGEELIKELGDVLKGIVKQNDIVARHQGNMFALLLPGAGIAQTNPIVQRILDTIEEPIAVAGNAIDVTAWIGEAVYPDHGVTAKTLLQRADTAIYEAQKSARRYALYDPDQDPHKPERLSIMGELRQGLERDQFQLYFQPKIEIGAGTLIAAEALIRWRHPTRGFLAPDQFIPLAEQTGNIQRLTAWTIAHTIAQLAEWRGRGLALKVALNLSARDLTNRRLPDLVARHLATRNVPAADVILEITESAVMIDPQQSLEVLGALDAMGLTLAIDDYGIGYSSMSYLRRLPVRELKIDKSFVVNLPASPGDEIIVRSTIELGHNLGLRVTAEGIETAETLAILRRLECDTGQGYLIAKPMPAAEFEDFARSSRWARPH